MATTKTEPPAAWTQAELRARQARISPPPHELPVTLAVPLVVGRGQDVVVALTAVQVYREGISLEVLVRMSTSPPGRSLSQLIAGGAGAGRESRLLLGVEFPDGRSAVAGDRLERYFGNERAEGEPRLTAYRGMGGVEDTAWDQQYWLAPVPPAGPLAFVCTWPAGNIPVTRTVLEGVDLPAAAAGSTLLWLGTHG